MVSKPKEQYEQERTDYEKALKEWQASEDYRNYQDMQKILRDMIFFQQANGAQDEVNGGITAQKQADGLRIISIMETADESTFMHEMAHEFLYDLQDLAQIDDASANKELELVNEWAECIPPYRRLRR